MAPPVRKPLARFWGMVALPNDAGCMVWQGAIDPITGYGRFTVGGHFVMAHRASLLFNLGPPPTVRHESAHSCRTKACVAPDHLRWATSSENKADQVRDGTDSRGEKSHRAKLTAVQVQTIRASHEGGVSQRQLGRQYGVSNQQIKRIVDGESWGWLG